MRTAEQIAARRDALIATKSSGDLLDMAEAVHAQLDTMERGSDDWRAVHRVYLWLLEAVEARHDVNDYMDAWVMADDERTYVQALRDAVAEVSA